MRMRSGWRALVWLVSFAGAGWLLLRLGRVEWMRVDWSDPSGWLAAAEAEVALAALGRLVALALLGWIGFSTIVYLAVRLLGVEARVDWLSIGPFRRMVDALLAGYLLVGSIAPAGAASGPPAPPATAEVVDPGYIPVPAGSDTPRDRPEPAGREAEPKGTVTVAAGDHLWKLAEERLGEAMGRSPTDAEIAPYWARVVEANRHRIRSGDPDLIFPGEEIVLPPVQE